MALVARVLSDVIRYIVIIHLALERQMRSHLLRRLVKSRSCLKTFLELKCVTTGSVGDPSDRDFIFQFEFIILNQHDITAICYERNNNNNNNIIQNLYSVM